MNGVGFKLSGRTSVPKEPLGYPAPEFSSFKISFVISKIDTMISQNRLSDISQSPFCDVKTSSEMRSFKSNENIHKKEDGSYYVVSANKASSVTL